PVAGYECHEIPLRLRKLRRCTVDAQLLRTPLLSRLGSSRADECAPDLLDHASCDHARERTIAVDYAKRDRSRLALDHRFDQRPHHIWYPVRRYGVRAGGTGDSVDDPGGTVRVGC